MTLSDPDSALPFRATRALAWITLLATLALGCGRADEAPLAVHLVDRFEPSWIVDPWEGDGTAPAGGAWEFEEAGEEGTAGWRGVTGVEGLRVEEGRLVGELGSESAVLGVQREVGLDVEDQLHSIVVRMRIDSGDAVEVWFSDAQEPPSDEEILRRAASPRGLARWSAELVPGDAFQTYVLQAPVSRSSSGIRQVFVRLDGLDGGRVAIDEFRVVLRGEHLAEIPSGTGWQGLDEVFRETLVARAPERIRAPVELPADGWLDLNLGTVGPRPVSFEVRVVEPGSEPGSGSRIFERTVTTPHRWEPVRLALDGHGGREVVLELALSADEEGTLGLWGSPTVRRSLRSAEPLPTSGPEPVTRTDPEGADRPPRGVILVIGDTLRSGHLDAYGYDRPTAPTLRAMAGEGVLFEDVVAQATWTKVSVPSILTSLSPTSHRIVDVSDRLPGVAVTLAEVYRDAGYATAAYSSVPFTGRLTNLQQGFEELHESSSVPGEEYPSKTARPYVDRLAEWLERHRDVPFFVLLHVFDPHDPYEPRSPWDAEWADPARAEAHERAREKAAAEMDEPLLQQFGMPDREALETAGVDAEAFVEHDIAWYDGSIQGMDAEVRRLLDVLRNLGLGRRTLVAFTSDHGEEFLDHGRTFHGQSVYGELTRVPLILWRGGASAGSRPGEPAGGLRVRPTVSSLDIMPTLLRLSRLEVPEFVQGQSLLPLMEATRRVAAGGTGTTSADGDPDAVVGLAGELGWQPAPAVSVKASTADPAAPPPHETEAYAIVLDGWKLIHNTVPAEGKPEYELYRFEEDPLDQNDVAAEHPEVVERLAGELEDWRRRMVEAQLPEAASMEELSPEQRERLRSLGYVQ